MTEKLTKENVAKRKATRQALIEDLLQETETVKVVDKRKTTKKALAEEEAAKVAATAKAAEEAELEELQAKTLRYPTPTTYLKAIKRDTEYRKNHNLKSIEREWFFPNFIAPPPVYIGKKVFQV